VHGRAAGIARRLAGSVTEGDDLLQEAVLRAFARLDALRDPSRFPAWFYTILLSVHRDRSRRAFWRRFTSLERGLEAGWDPPGADGAAFEEERRRAARASRALATQPAVQREAVVLSAIEGFSVEEIAAMQQATVSAVKSRLARGRSRLRRYYERRGITAARHQAGLGREAPLSAGGL
jgi:RNA polymerase sigma-70 factor (ECF subfamily)